MDIYKIGTVLAVPIFVKKYTTNKKKKRLISPLISIKWNKNKGCYYLYFKIAETIDFSTFSIRKKYYFT